MKNYPTFWQQETTIYQGHEYYELSDQTLDGLCREASDNFDEFKKSKSIDMFQRALNGFLSAARNSDKQSVPIFDFAHCYRRAASVAMRWPHHEERGNYLKDAESYLTKALTMAETVVKPDSDSMVVNEYQRMLALLANVSLELKNGQQLESCTTKLINSCKTHPNKAYLHDAYLYDFHVAMAKNKLPDAEIALKKAQRLATMPIHSRHLAVTSLVKASVTEDQATRDYLLQNAKNYLWVNYDANKKKLGEIKEKEARKNNARVPLHQNSNHSLWRSVNVNETKSSNARETAAPSQELCTALKRVMNDIVLLFKIRLLENGSQSARRNALNEADKYLDNSYRKKCLQTIDHVIEEIAEKGSSQLAHAMFDKVSPISFAATKPQSQTAAFAMSSKK